LATIAWDELQLELAHAGAFDNVSVFLHTDEAEICSVHMSACSGAPGGLLTQSP
jgi:hypothetical protein